MTQIWISAAGLCGATIIGSIMGFLFKGLSNKWNDTVLGYCAGMAHPTNHVAKMDTNP